MNTEILVTGGGGLLGYTLKEICPEAVFLTRRDGDLTDLHEVRRLFGHYRPKRVMHLAAQVGGVKQNASENADLFTANVQINTNVLAVAREQGVSRLVSTLSSCVFEFGSPSPRTEEDVQTGTPFRGNLGYAYAKRMLDIQTRLLWEQYGARFSTLTPVTMYGPNDNWDLETGHVVGSLIHRCFLAKQKNEPLKVWGTGQALRQFVYSGDVARILLQALESFTGPETTLVAPDSGIAIREVAPLIARAMRFEGPVVFDTTQPEGERVKVIESRRFSNQFPNFCFTPLEEGIQRTVDWFLNRYESRFAKSSAR